jgi:hypothetical protein
MEKIIELIMETMNIFLALSWKHFTVFVAVALSWEHFTIFVA